MSFVSLLVELEWCSRVLFLCISQALLIESFSVLYARMARRRKKMRNNLKQPERTAASNASAIVDTGKLSLYDQD